MPPSAITDDSSSGPSPLRVTNADWTSEAGSESRKGSARQKRSRDMYSPPAPYSPPSSPSSPSLLRVSNVPQQQSCDPTGHAPNGRRKRRRQEDGSRSPERSSDHSRLAGESGISASQASRKRLLEHSSAKSGHEGCVVKRRANAESARSLSSDVERRDLLDRADEVLERLRGDQSVDDCDDVEGLLDKEDQDTLNVSNHRMSMADSERDHLLDRADEVLERLGDTRSYGNSMDDSDLLNSDSELPDSDLTSLAAPSRRRSQQVLSRVHVLMRAPAGPHVTVTTGDGERVYLRLREEEENRRNGSSRGDGVRMEGSRTQRSHQQLLTVPFSELKANVEEEVMDTLLPA